MTKPINIAVVGYGGMGAYHADQLIPAQKQLTHVIGTYDINQAKRELAQKNGHKVYSSFSELLHDPAVEAVLIATPNDVHKELTIAALAAGKHVICEKPAAMDAAEFDEMVAAAKQHDRTLMIHQNRRWDPDFLIMKELYQKQTMGEIFQIESRVHGANGIPGDWRHLEKHGGGMLLDWGIHLLDQLLWLVKSPVKEIYTDLSYILGDEVDDGFISFLTFENGVKAIVEVGTTNYVSLPRWYAKGLNGTMKIDDWDLSGELVVSTNSNDAPAPTPIQAGVGLTKTMAPPSEEATQRLPLPKPAVNSESFYENFYHVIRDGKEPIVKNEEVQQTMMLIDNIFKSAQTK